jgi:pyruvate formate lyase activating enzyme
MTDEIREAMLYETLDERLVHCFLCAHECRIAPGQLGFCQVRRNDDGTLRTLNYRSLVALNPDPIEKKPLFHFLPGTRSLSLAAPGCNMRCDFCQNWQISQSPRTGRIEGEAISPAQIVAAAKRYDCPSISYTYTEPTIFFELAYDTSELAHAEGIRNVFVSNGYMTPQAVRTIAPLLDAINVDLKAFRDETYRRIMKARLEPVLTCLRELVAAGVWLEVTTLVVPGMNDSTEELRDIANFIGRELGPQVPWHVSRFHPDYEMPDGRPTPIEKLIEAAELGREAGLEHVYAGNVPGEADESTYCPQCHKQLLARQGFMLTGNRLTDGHCPDCSRDIAGVWE